MSTVVAQYVPLDLVLARFGSDPCQHTLHYLTHNANTERDALQLQLEERRYKALIRRKQRAWQVQELQRHLANLHQDPRVL
jgi:hypothetical protein